MSKSLKELIITSESDKSNVNNINRGQPIYYKKELYYIVFEFEDNIIISKNKDLSKAFCVKKNYVSVNPKK
jgi:hypothetical protein